MVSQTIGGNKQLRVTLSLTAGRRSLLICTVFLKSWYGLFPFHIYAKLAGTEEPGKTKGRVFPTAAGRDAGKQVR